MWAAVQRRTAASVVACTGLLWAAVTGWAQLGTQLGAQLGAQLDARLGTQTAAPTSESQIPHMQVTALDGHTVYLPEQLPGRATVLIVGFGRHSADATTAWERPVRTQLAHTPAVGFFDVAMLADVPRFVRPLVVHTIRHQVPDVLRPNFLPLAEREDDWKRVAGYAADRPEAAYVLLVDSTGRVRWSTHAPFSQAGFAQLREAAQRIAVEPKLR